MWIHLAPLRKAPTAQVGQTGLLLFFLCFGHGRVHSQTAQKEDTEREAKAADEEKYSTFLTGLYDNASISDQ